MIAAGCSADEDSRQPRDLETEIAEPDQALRPANARGKIPTSEKIADYAIEARLDTDAKRIEGHTRITWKNRSARAVDHIPIRLYMNAFRAEDTAWMRAAKGRHRGVERSGEHPWGYCDVHSVARVHSAEAGESPKTTPLQWQERHEPTLGDITLDKPVAAGGTLVLDIDFTTKLPRVYARTGFADDFYLVGQWFPKVSVLDRQGVWHAPPFTLNAEFFSDFGDYDVALDVPASLQVAASGIRVDDTVTDDRRLLRYHAAMVHDFAWTAAPRFAALDSHYNDITIRQRIAPEFAAQGELHLEILQGALASAETRFGPYPWSSITLVLPPSGAEGAMGMEYPTLFTTGPSSPNPPLFAALGYEERISGLTTTIHEFAHQYFQGLLASDESTEPWLDEGLTTAAQGLIMEDLWGPDPWVARIAGHPLRRDDMIRIGLAQTDAGTQIVDAPADTFDPVLNQFGAVVYLHTGALVATLRNLVGPEPFDDALRAYVDTFRFRHPKGADFEASLLRSLGDRVRLGTGDVGIPGSGDVYVDVADVLSQGLRTTAAIDFEIARVVNVPNPGAAGFHRDEQGALVGGQSPSHDVERPEGQTEGVVVVHRRGEFRVPVEIEIRFRDGEPLRLWWNGQARVKILRFPQRHVIAARADPRRLLVLETTRKNNDRLASKEVQRGGPVRGWARTAESLGLATMAGFGP